MTVQYHHYKTGGGHLPLPPMLKTVDLQEMITVLKKMNINSSWANSLHYKDWFKYIHAYDTWYAPPKSSIWTLENDDYITFKSLIDQLIVSDILLKDETLNINTAGSKIQLPFPIKTGDVNHFFEATDFIWQPDKNTWIYKNATVTAVILNL